MASINFPAYGSIQFSGYNEKPRPIVYRTTMEGGPPKQARQYSQTFVERNITYRFSASEFVQFKTWFYDTALHGSQWFNWNDPIDHTNKEARIVGGQINFAPMNARALYWMVSFVLESYE
jgi:hypothetical protein